MKVIKYSDVLKAIDKSELRFLKFEALDKQLLLKELRKLKYKKVMVRIRCI